MSSHKGSAAAQGNGAPASNRDADSVELTELGPLLEEKGKRAVTNPTKAEEEQTCPVPQEEEEEVRVLTLPLQAHHAMEKMEEFVYKVWEGRWRVIPYDVLPDWLKDNDYLLHGHRPPMPSFRACFRSIFRIHTETGNIWTHLLGFVLFLFLGILTMLRPNMYFMAPLQEKVVFGMFFLGAVLCLSFSWLFHTVYCHSEKVSRTFSKLDYSGIALLIMGSFVPWLYYSFYCSPQPRLIYLSIVCVLGISAIIVAQWDRFATPKHRQTRAVPGPRAPSVLSPYCLMGGRMAPKDIMTNTHAKSILNSMNALRKSSTLCDVTLRVEQKDFPAHRIVLAACSDYFCAMFTSELSEKGKPYVDIQGLTASTMEILLDFVYTETVHVTVENVQELLPAACLLQLKGVKQACCEFLESQLDPSNCLGIRDFAETHNCVDLMQAAEVFSQKHFPEVVQHEEFILLSQGEVEKLIKCDEIQVDSEEPVFEAVINWVKHAKKEREESLPDLLQYVRMPLLTPRYITDVIDAEEPMRCFWWLGASEASSLPSTW
uniref:Kelch like family member 12 n=1 Tax=Oryctolagus cuniculus TaxID=9986 RepID=A0A5F9CV28_RABIT